MAPEDLEPLTDLWTQGWRDGHASIVPEALLDLRTRDSFHARLKSAPDIVQVAGPVGAPEAFIRLKGDELDQFYIHPSARGSGLAHRLMDAAENALRGQGFTDVWLACSVGNDRAARFYEKCGWRNAGVRRLGVETLSGPFELDVWRYEKAL